MKTVFIKKHYESKHFQERLNKWKSGEDHSYANKAAIIKAYYRAKCGTQFLTDESKEYIATYISNPLPISSRFREEAAKLLGDIS